MRAYCCKIIHESDPEYQHKHIGKTLYIEKDGINMKFDEKEIIQILIALDAISNDSLDYYKIESGNFTIGTKKDGP